MTNETTNDMQGVNEMSLDELDAISAGSKNLPTAKKRLAENAQSLGDRILFWTARKLQELGL